MRVEYPTRFFKSLCSPRLLFHLDRLSPEEGTSWDAVIDWLGERRLSMVGFDVYDTLLLRELNDQDALRLVLAERVVTDGAWTGTADEYLAARRSASQDLPGENLLVWYGHRALGQRADVDRCITAELDLETEITHAVPGAVEALARIRERGVALAFVSDMHLPDGFIGDLLTREGLRRPAEPLFVSGTVGRWKSRGGLFHHWLDTVGLRPKDVAYVGNHPFADWAMPASMGLHVKGRRNGNPGRYETCMSASGVAGAAVAAASTRARLALDASGRDINVVLGTAVAGQTLMAFLLAIRSRCHTDDIRQVVFVARDGDLLYRMAEAMPKEYWSGIELHYLHGNRLTWTLAGAHSVGVDTWMELGTAGETSFLLQRLARTPFRALLRRLGLTIDDLHDHALADLEPGSPLANVDDVWPGVLSDPRLRTIVADRAAERFRLVSDYVRSAGLREEVTLIVDVGWRGQTAAVVSGIFEEVLAHRPVNYHFGGCGVQPELDAACRIERYAFDDSLEPRPFVGIDQCVEMFTGAGQPRATRYERRGRTVVPVFDRGIEAMISPERDRIWEAAIQLAEMMPPIERLEQWTTSPAPDPSAVVELLRRFWTSPTRAEGLAGTHLSVEIDDEGRIVHAMSTPYRLAELFSKSPRRWRQGSAAASSPALRAVHRTRIAGCRPLRLL